MEDLEVLREDTRDQDLPRNCEMMTDLVTRNTQRQWPDRNSQRVKEACQDMDNQQLEERDTARMLLFKDQCDLIE